MSSAKADSENDEDLGLADPGRTPPGYHVLPLCGYRLGCSGDPAYGQLAGYRHAVIYRHLSSRTGAT